MIPLVYRLRPTIVFGLPNESTGDRTPTQVMRRQIEKGFRCASSMGGGGALVVESRQGRCVVCLVVAEPRPDKNERRRQQGKSRLLVRDSPPVGLSAEQFFVRPTFRKILGELSA